jgi:hypothetical protein
MSSLQTTHTSFAEKLIYESSNGDTWYLCEEPTTHLPAVKHVANLQSGGHVAYIDVETFLSSGEGPEHQAFRDLLNRNHSTTVLITYDIHQERGANYAALLEAIQGLGAWWHHLETVWVVRSGMTPKEIRDRLATHIAADDQLLVADITGASIEWAGLNKAGAAWLQKAVSLDTVLS